MDQLLSQIGQQGVLFAGMALVIWYLVNNQKKSDERHAEEKKEGDERCNALIQKMMDTILPVVGNCTNVLAQVKEKLDEKSDH